MGYTKQHAPRSREEMYLAPLKKRYVRDDLTLEDFEAAVEIVLEGEGVPAWVMGGRVPGTTPAQHNKGRPSFEATS